MRHPHKRCAAAIVVSMLGLAMVTGCDPDGGGLNLTPRPSQRVRVEESGAAVEAAQPVPTIVGRVNQNSAAMDFMLRAGGVDSKGEYVEAGRREAYDLNGTLLYRHPRDLYLQLQHALGGKLEIGSNAQEFWVWKRLGKDRYWWGTQAAADANQELDIPLRPTDIVEVLGLGRLPASLPREAVKVQADRYEVNLTERTGGGRLYTAKTIWIDRRPPYLVRRMVYYSAGGQARVDAYMDRYRVVEGSTVMVPCRIQIHWPQKGGHMRLEFATIKRFDSDSAARRFESPRQKGQEVGPMERVDNRVPGRVAR